MLDLYGSMDMTQSQLVSAETVEEEFKNMVKMVPGVLAYFIKNAYYMIQHEEYRVISGRGVFESMRGRCKKFLGVERFGIDNRFSQHFVRAAIRKHPDLAPYFEQREYREKDFKVPNTYSRSWLPK